MGPGHVSRIAAVTLLIATAMAIGPEMQLDNRRASCPRADPDFIRIFDITAPVIMSACAADGAFTESLRLELMSQSSGQRQLWMAGVSSNEGPALEEWQRERVVVLGGHNAWQVPLDPDWSEDPYRNVTWTADYQSLGWLAPLANGYRDGRVALGHELVRYLMDWIDSNPVEQPASPRSWYDGSVHRRTNTVVAVWDVLLRVVDGQQLAKVLSALHQHGEELDSYLHDQRFYGHNHNLFHALALLNLARNVPLFAQTSIWASDATHRVHSLLREMVDGRDAVSTEQASGYHYLAMSLFASAEKYLQASGDALAPEDLDLLASMTRFGALLPDPNGKLPAIGDTGFGVSDAKALGRLSQVRELGLSTPEADFVVTHGASGRRPEDAMYFDGQGYAIFRPSYGDVGAWANDLHVTVDMGPNRRVHGHNDALNLLVAAWGKQLMVDSGGPYQYGVAERKAFVAASAHNTVVVDGSDYAPGDVAIERTLDGRLYSLITGSHDKSRGVHHQRSVMVVKPWLVLVVDLLDGVDERNHRFDLLYHLPPGADIDTAGTTVVVGVEQTAVSLAVEGGRRISMQTREGWVTPATHQRESAPVLDYSQTGRSAWFVTAIWPSVRADALAPELTVIKSGTSFVIVVKVGRDRWTIHLPPTGEPIVN